MMQGVFTQAIRPVALAVFVGWAMTATAMSTCEPQGVSGEALAEWRASGFTTTSPDAAALELVDCLGQPDPFLRDEVGYEGLTTLLASLPCNLKKSL